MTQLAAAPPKLPHFPPWMIRQRPAAISALQARNMDRLGLAGRYAKPLHPWCCECDIFIASSRAKRAGGCCIGVPMSAPVAGLPMPGSARPPCWTQTEEAVA